MLKWAMRGLQKCFALALACAALLLIRNFLRLHASSGDEPSSVQRDPSATGERGGFARRSQDNKPLLRDLLHARATVPTGAGRAVGVEQPRAASGDGPSCPKPAKARQRWREVEEKDLKLIRAQDRLSSVQRCEKRGGALILTLRLTAATKVKGRAFEMPFPDYILADELQGGGWRGKRSTLQLYVLTAGPSQVLKPLGPAHASHDKIAKDGNGAYSHWRPAMTAGPTGKSMLRFSTPGNVPFQKIGGLVAVVHPVAPAVGWIEFLGGKRVKHQEIFRKLYFRTFPTLGLDPVLADLPQETVPGAWYFWRIGGNGEFEMPLASGELYEKRLPYQIAEYYGKFEERGALLYPPAETYVYYQNKVALAKLFKETGVKTPATWVFQSLEEALSSKETLSFPVVIKDPYGFSSHGIRQASNWDEYTAAISSFFAEVGQGIEAIVQMKVVALREARVTYVDGKPFHGYWRIRKSLASASAASNLGGFQSFDFPLEAIAPAVARFANATGIPVGGVDFIWQEEDPDVTKEPYALEVSPTSDLNPPSPPNWKGTYAVFKHTPGYREAYLQVRRQWTDFMAIAVIDRYRRSKRHLFVDIDNVVALSAERVRRLKGDKQAYLAKEVMKDRPVPDAVAALRELRAEFFVRFLTARGQYEDPFNVTQTWLLKHGFEYDELLVVKGAEDKVAHLTSETILIDDFTVGHENEVPKENAKFKAKLKKAKLPFIVFPFGGLWADVMPKLKEEAKLRPSAD